MDNIVTQIWDKRMRPDWRKISEEEQEKRSKPRSDPDDAEFVRDINQIQDTAVDIEDGAAPQAQTTFNRCFSNAPCQCAKESGV